MTFDAAGGAGAVMGVLVALAVAALGLRLVAPALRRHRPGLWWVLFGFPAAWWRVVRRWREVMTGCGLVITRTPALAVLQDVIGEGMAPPAPVAPWRGLVRPTRGGFWLWVRLLPGQVPDDFVKAAPAFAHAWRVHGVRVDSPERGYVRLVASGLDPLVRPRVPRQRDDELLRVVVGVMESGRSWVLDLRRVPHWLIVGATRSGKSTLINAMVARLAPQPVALVGVDCKGGMELGLYQPRLSALATNRKQAVRLLRVLVSLTQSRMRLCRTSRARNVWALPESLRPVPVVVIVDEIAELFLVATREDKADAQAATTALIRIAQLGAALGVFLVVAGQRVGSDLGQGVTALRAQLAGRVCHRVADPETATMTLGDLNPDAVQAAQAIGPEEAGTAVVASSDGWERARSVLVTEAQAEATAAEYADLSPDIPELRQVLVDDGDDSGEWMTDVDA